jgi:hypothetical protein
MVATHQRRAGLVGAAATAGALILAGSAGADGGTGPSPTPDGQLVQASDGTLYLLVGGQAHPITPAPLTDEALRLLPTGDALPDGAFWLGPTAPPSAARFFATQTALAPRGASGQRTATPQAGRQQAAAQATALVRRSATARPFGQS